MNWEFGGQKCSWREASSLKQRLAGTERATLMAQFVGLLVGGTISELWNLGERSGLENKKCTQGNVTSAISRSVPQWRPLRLSDKQVVMPHVRDPLHHLADCALYTYPPFADDQLKAGTPLPTRQKKMGRRFDPIPGLGSRTLLDAASHWVPRWAVDYNHGEWG